MYKKVGGGCPSYIRKERDVDIARGELVESELDRFIATRSRREPAGSRTRSTSYGRSP
jgi:hypothetical protein